MSNDEENDRLNDEESKIFYSSFCPRDLLYFCVGACLRRFLIIPKMSKYEENDRHNDEENDRLIAEIRAEIAAYSSEENEAFGIPNLVARNHKILNSKSVSIRLLHVVFS